VFNWDLHEKRCGASRPKASAENAAVLLKVGNMTKINVNFNSNGLRVAGHLYVPDGANVGRRPAVIVGHPGSGVKEQTAGLYAERLSRAGFVTLAFDATYQGESEGSPRGLEDPANRVEDFKAAVSFLQTSEVVDPARIGVLGICASGGYVVTAAATDLRIKAVATISGVDIGSIHRQGPDGKQDPAVLQALLNGAAAARTAEARGEGVGYFPIFPESEEKARASGVFMSEGFDYFAPLGHTTPEPPHSSPGAVWIALQASTGSKSPTFYHLGHCLSS
jgi:uncharacterized protein